ncbi:MAG: ATP-binding cassette domain-containing protein [Bdellovibrionales bacterium]|nr:ATP-binding cassette domain-containing protein [Bdellovibrionales bacterium]
MNPQAPLFELTSIDFGYAASPVFRGLSLTVEAGQSVCLVGPGACGKSTLLKLAIGLLRPQSGEVYYKGRALSHFSRAERVQLARELGVCLQNSGLFDSRSCEENLAFVLREHTSATPAHIKRQVREAMESVGLGGNESAFVHELSGGMKKRLGIARAFLLRPQVVLLDDPTAGLDPITSRQIIDLIVEFKQRLDLALFVITSDPPKAFEMADRILLLANGEILADGPAQQLKEASGGPLHRFLRGLAPT